MQIDKDVHLVNTERMRLKKLSAKFWKEVESVEKLTDLLLISVDDVSPYLEKIQHLQYLEKLKLAQVELDDRISKMVLPSTLVELHLSSIICADWSKMPAVPQVRDFVHKRMPLDSLLHIYPKLTGVNLIKLNTNGDDELDSVHKALPEITGMEVLELEVFDGSEDKLVAMFEYICGREIKMILSYSGDMNEEKMMTLISAYSSCVSISAD